MDEGLARAKAARKLKDTLTGLATSYHSLLDIAEIKEDKQTTTREGFQATVHATALVQGAQTLLGLAAELQLSRALGGPGGGGADDAVDAENAANARAAAASRAALVRMRGDITALLNELEEHYYSSSEHEPQHEQQQEQQEQEQQQQQER